MFTKFMCKVLGITFHSNTDGSININLDKMAKKYPTFTEHVIKNLAQKLENEGATVIRLK